MHIERMHHTIKYIYLHGKNVKHLDKAIVALMSFVRDKLFDSPIILSKGKLTTKLKDITKRHKPIREIDSNSIIREGTGNGWKVPSSSGMKEVHIFST